MSRNLKIAQISLGAAFIAGVLGLSALPASAHDGWGYADRRDHRQGRVIVRCDRDGDDCRYYRCDWDGDDCYRIARPYAAHEPPRYYPRPRDHVFFGFSVGR
jgi:hypothetical protein